MVRDHSSNANATNTTSATSATNTTSTASTTSAIVTISAINTMHIAIIDNSFIKIWTKLFHLLFFDFNKFSHNFSNFYMFIYIQGTFTKNQILFPQKRSIFKYVDFVTREK